MSFYTCVVYPLIVLSVSYYNQGSYWFTMIMLFALCLPK